MAGSREGRWIFQVSDGWFVLIHRMKVDDVVIEPWWHEFS
jgi:hypothetical protein